jgi:glycosyltransferase involved in cell wall biosynthesis
MSKKKIKILFIMNAPAPIWVEYSKIISNYFECYFIFYSTCKELGRPEWWDMELPNNMCVVRDGVFRRNHKFIDVNIIKRVKGFSPNVVYTSGFNLLMSPFLYYYCKFNSIKFIYLTEIWRKKGGTPRKYLSTLLGLFYSNIDIFYVSGREGRKYWENYISKKTNIKNLEIPGNVDKYINHPVRVSKQDAMLFFGHRLIDIYNPLLALDILTSVQRYYPDMGMYMNACGNLRCIVDEYIVKKSIKNVEFIIVDSESDLDFYYSNGDISITPAKYSYGNIGTNEAMASGMPILISNNVKYHSEQISMLKNGFILPMDVDSFSEKIVDYIKSKDLLSSHSIRSKNIIKYLGTEVVFEKFKSEVDALFKVKK